jgi:UDP-2,3-diacylglucosamine pyrophosphatase LpxH
MHLLILSDLHLGKGKYLSDGQVNIQEEFTEDDKFEEFLEYYSTEHYYDEEVHLLLNGDILNLTQLDVDDVYTHLQTEEFVEKMVKSIVQGHPLFFGAIQKFLSKPNKRVTYIFGNHDIAMIFPKAQKVLEDAVGGKIAFTHQYIRHGVLVEHGHRFEPHNTVPRSKLIIKGPEDKDIINLPWASLFCLYLLPKLKLERPHIDKIRPLSLYLRWTLLHDLSFFIKLTFVVVWWCIRTQFSPWGKFNKNFKLKLRQVFKIAVHPNYITNAKRILKARPDVNLVIMGHTHIREVKRFKDGRHYINCGTWNPVPSIDIGLHHNINHLSYVQVEVDEGQGQVKNAFLNSWQGKWRPFIEENSTSINKSRR